MPLLQLNSMLHVTVLARELTAVQLNKLFNKKYPTDLFSVALNMCFSVTCILINKAL